VHHPPWTAFRTQMTWTARVLHRNRLAIAAAYGAGRGVITSSLLHQVKHVLSGHLLTAELWEDAIDAMRAGPDAWMGRDLQRTRDDGERIVRAWHRDHDLPPETSATRGSPMALPVAVLRAVRRPVMPDRPPQAIVAAHAGDAHWRTTLGAAAVLVADDDVTTVSAFVVRGADMRRALRRSLLSHLGLAVRWRSLVRRYRAELPRHTTPDSWSARFAAAAPERTEERRVGKEGRARRARERTQSQRPQP